MKKGNDLRETLNNFKTNVKNWWAISITSPYSNVRYLENVVKINGTDWKLELKNIVSKFKQLGVKVLSSSTERFGNKRLRIKITIIDPNHISPDERGWYI